ERAVLKRASRSIIIYGAREAGGVAREGAAQDGEPSKKVGDGPARDGRVPGVAGQRAIVQRQSSDGKDGPARVAVGGVAIGEHQSVQRDGDAAPDIEDARAMIAIDDNAVGHGRSIDGEVVGNRNLPAGESDGLAREVGGEGNRAAALE